MGAHYLHGHFLTHKNRCQLFLEKEISLLATAVWTVGMIFVVFKEKNCTLTKSKLKSDCFPSKHLFPFSANNRIYALHVVNINLTVCCFCLTLSVEEESMEGKWRSLLPEPGPAPAGTQLALCVPLVKSFLWTLSISTTTARSFVEDTTPSF